MSDFNAKIPVAKTALLAMAIAAAVISASPGQGAVISWSGAASSDWSTGANWAGGVAPANDKVSSIADFNLPSYAGNPPFAPTLSTNTSINGITIDSTSGPLTIAPTTAQSLTIGSAGIVMSTGAGATTIAAPVVAWSFPVAAANAGQNSETWINNSAGTLAFTGAITHQAGSVLNIQGTGPITTINTNGASGIIGPWMTFGAGAATQYAYSAGGTLSGYTGTSVTDVSNLVSNTVNYELTNTGLNALTNSTLTTSGAANTLRYTGSDAAITIGGTATAVTLTTSGILDAGTGTLTFANGSSNAGGLVIGAAETVFDAVSGNIEFSAPVINTSASTREMTLTGAGHIGFNTVTNLGSGSMYFRGYGDTNGTPSGKIMIGASHTLTFNATDGSIYAYSPISDNADGTPSSVIINTTGANRVRFGIPGGVTGSNTFSGGLTVTAGSNFQLVDNYFGSNSSLGTGTFTIQQGAGIFTQASFNSANNNPSLWEGDFTVNNANGTLTMGSGQITMAPTNSSATAITITNNGLGDVYNSNGVDFGPITDNGHGLGLTLASGGMRLSGADTFTGKLSVLAGQVYVNNDKALNRDMVVVLNGGAKINLGSEDNEVLAGLQDGANAATPSEVGTLSSGRQFFIVGSGNYTFSGNIDGGTYPQDLPLSMAGAGTQTLAGPNSSYLIPAAIYQGGAYLYSGTLKLDFNAPTAPAANILFNNTGFSQGAPSTTISNVIFGAGRLLVNGSSTQATSQSFAQITVGNAAYSLPSGEAKIQLVNNGQDVALNFGNITAGSGGVLNVTLPSGAQTVTNGVLTTASNTNGIIGLGQALVSSGANVDWAVSGAAHVAAGASTGAPGTWDDGTLSTNGSGSITFYGTETNGTPISFNTLTGSGVTNFKTGQLYYVIQSYPAGYLGSNPAFFQVAAAPGATAAVGTVASGSSGGATFDTLGNITAYTGYTAGFTGVGTGSGGTDVNTNNYLITGSVVAGVGNDVVNTLKIANTSPAVLDVSANVGGLMQFTADSILFTGTANFTIVGDPTYRLNGLGGELVFDQYGAGNLTLDVKIRNNPLTKNGPGTLTLTSPNDDFNTLTLNGGILNFNALHTLGIGTTIIFNGGTLQYASPTSLSPFLGSGDVTLGGSSQTSARTLIFDSAGATIDTNGNNITLSGNIGGGDANGFNAFFGNSLPTGGFTKAGAGKLTLGGLGNYGGPTTLAGGTLSVGTIANGGVASSIGMSLNAAENLIFNGGALQYTGAGASTDRNFTLTSSGGTIDASGTGTLTFSNTSAIALTGSGARTLSLIGSNTGNNTLDLSLGDGQSLALDLQLSPDASIGGSSPTSLLKDGAGTWVLNSVNSYSGGTTINNGTLVLAAAGALPNATAVVNNGTLTVNANNTASVITGTGTTNIAAATTLAINATPVVAGPGPRNANATTSVMGSLNIAGGATPTGTFNLNNNALIITGGGTAERDLASSEVANARNGGLWNQPGITSTNAQASFAGTHFDSTTLGVVLNSDLPTPYATFNGKTVGASDVLIKYTYGGDADLSGTINGNDYFQIDRGFLDHYTGWVNGDFNYDGTVNGNDYFIIDSNFIDQSGQLAASEVLAHAAEFGPSYLSEFTSSQLAAIGVPEPTSLALLGLGAVGLLARRKRKA